MKNIDEIKKEYFQWLEKAGEIEKKIDLTMRKKLPKIDERLALFEESFQINIDFDRWATKNNVEYRQINSWIKEVEPYVVKYYDWCSNPIVRKTMKKSVDLTDENEIRKMINDAIKVLAVVGCTEENSFNEIHEYLEYLRIINEEYRHNIYNGTTTVFAVDILENRGLYQPYREGFMMGVLRVMEKVDSIFLCLCKKVDLK